MERVAVGGPAGTLPGNVFYQRFKPTPRLAADVECYWYLRRTPAAGEAVERILPDGCSELIFNLRSPFRAVNDDGTRGTQPCALLVGQISRRLLIEPSGDVEILAVRFTPAGASAFFPFALSEITDTHAALAALGGDWRELEERLHDLRTIPARLRLLEDTLLAHRGSGDHARVAAAVTRLCASGGALRIEALADELNVSARQLERDFTRRVGLRPKQFARITRFQRVLQAMSTGDHGWVDVAADCGYSDQAHLVNEFRALSGLAPREHFRNETAMGAVLVG